jgi:hypothetical protein
MSTTPTVSRDGPASATARQEAGRRPLRDDGPAERKKKRMSRRSLMLLAGAAAAVSFALPWVTIRALPTSVLPADRQVIAVPSTDRFIVTSGTTQTGTGVAVAPTTGTAPLTATRASAPAPPGA